jgi:multidrug efflux pump subunit AcrA (membrane-fusion protein)
MRHWRMFVAFAAILAGLTVLSFQSAPALSAADPTPLPGDATDPGFISGVLIKDLQEIDVPADLPSTEGGMLMELKVREGDEMKAGDVLAQIDDRQAKLAVKGAQCRVVAAEMERDNEISVKYAAAKHDVAVKAFEKGIEANKREPNTVPFIELLKLKLEAVASDLEIEHAKYQLQIAAANVNVRNAELAVADLDVARRQIKCRMDGIVVKRYKQEGEWVRSGDPIVRVLRMDRLKIETHVDPRKFTRDDVEKRKVTFSVLLPDGRRETFEGIVNFASPEQVSSQMRLVTVDIVNRQNGGHWILGPGMRGDMVIHLKK